MISTGFDFTDIVADSCIVCTSLFAVLVASLRWNKAKKKDSRKDSSIDFSACELCKQLETDLSFGGPAKVLSTWRALNPRRSMSARALRMVVEAFVDIEPDSLVCEISTRMNYHPKLCTPRIVTNLLEILARAGLTTAMEELLHNMRQHHDIPSSDRVNEIFLDGFASTGHEEKVSDLLLEINSRSRVTPRGYCLMIKGFLDNRMVDAAFSQMKEMRRQGLFVPTFAVAKLCRLRSEIDNCVPTIDDLEEYSMPVDAFAVTILMQDCLRRHDVKAAFRVEKLARIDNVNLTMNAYDSFLLLCVSDKNEHAFKLFGDMQKLGLPSRGLCLGLIVRCAKSRFCQFADMVADYMRENSTLDFQAYGALMKVYASCGMYNEACDLYPEILKNGLKPDSVMYGCLMKFAAECGRADLSQELSRAAPQLDIQNYIALIQAARHDKDIDRAFQVVNEMKASGVKVDLAAYSCVLDVCVLAGDMKRARSLIEQMRQMGSLDVVVYNTLLKGYCNLGDCATAVALLSEMDAAGIEPNEVTFNSIINAFAAIGNCDEAWSLVETMEKRGLKIDSFTMSSLMKALKNALHPQPKRVVADAFTLLDRSGVDVLDDEILLNVVFQTCTRYREIARIDQIFSSYMKSKRQPSLHTVCSLIKAASMLKQIDACRELWEDAIEKRKMMPSDYVLGYMLDALVSNECVDEAAVLLKKWKKEVTLNSFMYATIIKGFAHTNQSERAMELYEEIKDSGMHLNPVTLTALIEMQARLGAVEKVWELVAVLKSMGCKPDNLTSSNIIKTYLTRGDVDEAFRVFQVMQKEGTQFDLVYDVILDGCLQNNRLDLAELVAQGLEQNHIKPSKYTFSNLMKLYGLRKQVQKAFDVLERLSEEHGMKPSIRVETSLLRACLSNNEMEKAHTIFERIKARGGRVDVRAYNVMIRTNVRHGNLEEAVRLAEEVCEIGKRRNLDSRIMKQLLWTFEQHRRSDSSSVRLCEKLRALL